MSDDKVTLTMIRRQQQVVAELANKKQAAADEYYRLQKLKADASDARDEIIREHQRAEDDLLVLGRRFALDLSETNYTPQIEATK